MTSFTIEVKDQGVQAALKALSARINNLNPMLQAIGEGIIERTKRRFDTSTGPDGVKWKDYPPGGATLTMLAERLGARKSHIKKDGSLNAKGQRAYANKKLLIGESQDLRRQIVMRASGNSLTVRATTVYAAMHQFGGITSPRSMIPGKIIPARPFLPIHQDGTLYPDEQVEILKAINEYLVEGL
jgi:phage gpG-like protein